MPPEFVQVVGHVEAGKTVVFKKVFKGVSVQNSDAGQLQRSHHSSTCSQLDTLWERRKKEKKNKLDLCPEEQKNTPSWNKQAFREQKHLASHGLLLVTPPSG